MNKYISKFYNLVINPPSDEELAKVAIQADEILPTIWLLGKTGSGKSSIVQQLTGETRAEIGTGFMPCTKQSGYYDYPATHPIFRFLDTKGLGEIGYDPTQDIAQLSQSSNALLIVSKLRDAQQSELINSLITIRKTAKHITTDSIVVVHTGAFEIENQHDLRRAITARQKLFEEALKSKLDYCVVDFSEDSKSDSETLHDFGSAQLKSILSDKLPLLKLWIAQQRRNDGESESYQKLNLEILWYSGTAAASDALPLVGLVSVPAIQGKMLHSLAQQYGVEWDTRMFSEFIAALGSTFALRYAASMGGRQLVKLIPVYGQIAGAALAVTISYASTYALGRAACSYLYHKKTQSPIDEEKLKLLYKDALGAGKEFKHADRELREP